MKYLRRIMLVLCLVIAIIGLAACQKAADRTNVTEDNSTKAAKEVTTSPTKSATKNTQYPVTITDSDGNKVTIASEPKKVVSMAPNITELVCKLGLENELIGRTTYCDYPKEVSKIEAVGTLQQPDIEKIISLEPDIVIASTHFSKEAEKQLTDLGVKVIVLYEEHDVSGVYKIIETLGTIFNRNAVATDVVREMKTSIETTKKAVADLKAPSVYYVIGFGEYGDYTAGGDTFVGQLITLAGGKNIAQGVSGWSYNLESLLEADPDIIIMDNSMKNSFVKAKNYKDLSAVKNHRVYGIDKNTIERQGNRNAEGLRTLAQIFHPEAFK